MNPTVIAATIAAVVSALTLVGTLAAQYRGFREQRKHLDLTLAEQSKQLDRTLAEQRTRTWNERFATAAEQLGSDKPAAVRLAGVYAMAGLADDWEANRQTCVDVLCAYLRMPYEPDPGKDSSAPEQLAFQSSREVRHTVIRVIAAHLRDGAAVSWQGLNFDLTGVVFDGGDFSRAEFTGGEVSFSGAVFFAGKVSFTDAVFSGGKVTFSGAVFSSLSEVSFTGAVFSGEVTFSRALFSGGEVSFSGAVFTGGKVSFSRAVFSAGTVYFNFARFADDTGVNFARAIISGGQVSFACAEFFGGTVNFRGAEFSGGTVNFSGGEFSGSAVYFDHAVFSGGEVDFSRASDWSAPPIFPWTDAPPSGVKLRPAGMEQTT
jgi:uncharacterized protein YjbI with pentapeptide repeats